MRGIVVLLVVFLTSCSKEKLFDRAFGASVPAEIVCLNEVIIEYPRDMAHRYYGKFQCPEMVFHMFVEKLHLLKAEKPYAFPSPSKADWWLANSKFDLFTWENTYYSGFEGEDVVGIPRGKGVVVRYGDGEMYLYKSW